MDGFSCPYIMPDEITESAPDNAKIRYLKNTNLRILFDLLLFTNVHPYGKCR